MDKDYIKLRGKALEVAYFIKKNAIEIQSFKESKRKETAKQFLKALMNIGDEELIEKAQKHGIEPENFTVLSYIPLVFVAWSDGSMEKAEKRKILEFLEDDGISKSGPEKALINTWLDNPPSEELVEVWKAYFFGLRQLHNEGSFQQLKQNIFEHAYGIAKCSGLLGIPSVTSQEKAFLNDLKELLNL